MDQKNLGVQQYKDGGSILNATEGWLETLAATD
jgi:hypothetical protein